MSDVVQKLWGFCHTLRYDSIDYGDHIEQITYLLFLKMADERGRELPKGCEWPSLRDESGTALIDHKDLIEGFSSIRPLVAYRPPIRRGDQPWPVA